MAWRQLPDGTYFNPDTGDLRGIDEQRESAARAHSRFASRVDPVGGAGMNPVPPIPTQKMVELPQPNGATTEVIFPKPDLLATNPFALGLDGMSETQKKLMLVAGILGVAFVSTKFFR